VEAANATARASAAFMGIGFSIMTELARADGGERGSRKLVLRRCDEHHVDQTLIHFQHRLD
jgi:hypothetical protein